MPDRTFKGPADVTATMVLRNRGQSSGVVPKDDGIAEDSLTVKDLDIEEPSLEAQ